MNPFQKGLSVHESKQKVTEVVSLVKNGGKTTISILSPLCPNTCIRLVIHVVGIILCHSLLSEPSVSNELIPEYLGSQNHEIVTS